MTDPFSVAKNLTDAIVEAAAEAIYGFPLAQLHEDDAEAGRANARVVLAAALPLLADAVEAERAEAVRGRPGYAVGNATFNEAVDRAAALIRSAVPAVSP